MLTGCERLAIRAQKCSIEFFVHEMVIFSIMVLEIRRTKFPFIEHIIRFYAALLVKSTPLAFLVGKLSQRLQIFGWIQRSSFKFFFII